MSTIRFINTFDLPPADHAIWSNPRFVPSIHVRPANTAAGAGAQAAGIYQTILAEYAKVGRTCDVVNLWVQTLGQASAADPRVLDSRWTALLQHPSDGVDTPASIAHGTPIGVDSAWTPFSANGISDTTAWIDAFIAGFEAERGVLGIQGLPDELRLHWDNENNMGVNGVNGFGGAYEPFSGTYTRQDMGWWATALADPRASTELIDGTNTLAALVLAWLDEDGVSNALSMDYTQSILEPGNATNYRFQLYLQKRVHEYTMQVAVFDRFKAAYPSKSVKGSNWQVVPGNAPNATDQWLRLFARIHGDPGLSHDYAAPTYYPLRDTCYVNRDDTREADWRAQNNLIPILGNDVAEWERVSLDRCREQTARLTALIGADRIAPWIAFTGYAVNTGVAGTWTGLGATTATSRRFNKQVILDGLADGITEFLLWWPDSLIGDPATAYTDLHALLSEVAGDGTIKTRLAFPTVLAKPRGGSRMTTGEGVEFAGAAAASAGAAAAASGA